MNLILFMRGESKEEMLQTLFDRLQSNERDKFFDESGVLTVDSEVVMEYDFVDQNHESMSDFLGSNIIL